MKGRDDKEQTNSRSIHAPIYPLSGNPRNENSMNPNSQNGSNLPFHSRPVPFLGSGAIIQALVKLAMNFYLPKPESGPERSFTRVRFLTPDSGFLDQLPSPESEKNPLKTTKSPLCDILRLPSWPRFAPKATFLLINLGSRLRNIPESAQKDHHLRSLALGRNRKWRSWRAQTKCLFSQVTWSECRTGSSEKSSKLDRIWIRNGFFFKQIWNLIVNRYHLNGWICWNYVNKKERAID